MRSKSLLFNLLLAIVITLQSSCAVKALNRKTYSITHEQISGFYIASDGSSVAITGKEYHYLFPLDTHLKQALTWSERSRIQASFTAFNLLPDAKVEGWYTLKVSAASLDEEAKAQLLGMGFRLDDGVFTLYKHLAGSYYQPKSDGESHAAAFSKQYDVTLKKDASLPAVVKIPLTPFAYAADGVMVAGAIVFFTLYCTAEEVVGNNCLKLLRF